MLVFSIFLIQFLQIDLVKEAFLSEYEKIQFPRKPHLIIESLHVEKVNDILYELYMINNRECFQLPNGEPIILFIDQDEIIRLSSSGEKPLCFAIVTGGYENKLGALMSNDFKLVLLYRHLVT